MDIEISFEKRYIIIYSLVLAIGYYVLDKINIICGNIFSSILPIDIITLVLVLLILSIFDRNQKERVGLGFFYLKEPFEKGDKWIRKDKRLSEKDKIKMKNKLTNISNNEFYKNYYKNVNHIKAVNAKNSEYCVIRDISFALFIILIVIGILTIIWVQDFWIEFIFIFFIYVVSTIACRCKSKDFVCQIIVECNNLKEEKN